MRLTSVLGLLLIASSANSADLPRQSALGEVFAERPPRVVIRGHVETVQPPPDAGLIALAPRTPGYYGRPGDYAYRNYYGTSPGTIYSRLPYACGLVGLC